MQVINRSYIIFLILPYFFKEKRENVTCDSFPVWEIFLQLLRVSHFLRTKKLWTVQQGAVGFFLLLLLLPNVMQSTTAVATLGDFSCHRRQTKALLFFFGPWKCSSGRTLHRYWPKYGQRKRRASSLTLPAVGKYRRFGGIVGRTTRLEERWQIWMEGGWKKNMEFLNRLGGDSKTSAFCARHLYEYDANMKHFQRCSPGFTLWKEKNCTWSESKN